MKIIKNKALPTSLFIILGILAIAICMNIAEFGIILGLFATVIGLPYVFLSATVLALINLILVVIELLGGEVDG